VALGGAFEVIDDRSVVFGPRELLFVVFLIPVVAHLRVEIVEQPIRGLHVVGLLSAASCSLSSIASTISLYIASSRRLSGLSGSTLEHRIGMTALGPSDPIAERALVDRDLWRVLFTPGAISVPALVATFEVDRDRVQYLRVGVGDFLPLLAPFARLIDRFLRPLRPLYLQPADVAADPVVNELARRVIHRVAVIFPVLDLALAGDEGLRRRRAGLPVGRQAAARGTPITF
jgi:hypothetical protein